MQVNFSDAEYGPLCWLADYYGTTPAWLVHRWTVARSLLETHLLLKAQEERESRDGDAGIPPTPENPSVPTLERGGAS